MHSGQKQVVLGLREKERRERRKENRKRKKEKGRKKAKKNKRRNYRKKRGEKGWGKQSEIKKKHGGVSSDSVYFKSLDFPWKLYV